MRFLRSLLVVIGVVALIGGAGMETTETVYSCYDSTLGGSGCVETVVPNPMPKVMMIFTGLISLSGGIYGVLSEDSGSSFSKSDNNLKDQNQSLAEKIEERRNNK